MTVGVHVTHEAVQKLGGIGTVLQGLLVTKKYNKLCSRTMLYAPLFHRDGNPVLRLGEDSEVIYSGLDHYDQSNKFKIFSPIEEKYGVSIVYGKKKFKHGETSRSSTLVDIVAVDIWDMKPEFVNRFKFKLWEHFGLASDRYQHDRDYEQYLRIGAVLREIFEALYGTSERAIIFSHEYMGMGSALAFVMEKIEGNRKIDKTVFYAHEVSTARMVVEKHPGHDFAFYNIMQMDRDVGLSLEDEFGSCSFYSRNELVKRAVHLDYVFAVSDLTKEEYLYLCPNADESKIKTVYNGIPVEKVSYKEKERSIDLMNDYCEKLFNFRPDYIFTHVARLVISKAMWRDIRLLYHLDDHFAKIGKKGFFVLLSTLIGNGRATEDVLKMEADYGWPVVHREAWPDLVGQEVDIYRYLELFNARSKAIKGVFINQFGFAHKACGDRLPKHTTLFDLRLASDAEFGLSIYEPFGIAQLETLPYGGAPVISNVCGCAYLLHDTVEPQDYLTINFTDVPMAFKDQFRTKSDFISITKEMRDLVETEICAKYVSQVNGLLPQNNKQRKARFEKMQKQSKLLDWEHIAARINDYLL